jgi:hypothetical protein
MKLPRNDFAESLPQLAHKRDISVGECASHIAPRAPDERLETFPRIISALRRQSFLFSRPQGRACRRLPNLTITARRSLRNDALP